MINIFLDFLLYWFASLIGCSIGFICGYYLIRMFRRRSKVADGDVVKALALVLEIIKHVQGTGNSANPLSGTTGFLGELVSVVDKSSEDFYVSPIFQQAEKNFEKTGTEVKIESNVDKNVEALRKSLESKTKGR